VKNILHFYFVLLDVSVRKDVWQILS